MKEPAAKAGTEMSLLRVLALGIRRGRGKLDGPAVMNGGAGRDRRIPPSPQGDAGSAMSARDVQSGLQAKRVLVVEDEAMIRMLLEDMLSELGCTIAGATAHVDEAVEFAQTAEFDVAILDVNLNGQPILPVADILAT